MNVQSFPELPIRNQVIGWEEKQNATEMLTN
jgi:hypothetical protein